MAVRDVVQAAAGVGGGGEYVEDVFSTYLYTGNVTARDITNGTDLAGEGGMVWIKWRSGGQGYGNHELYDTNRGATKAIESSSTNAETTRSGGLTAFNSDGFSLGTFAYENGSGNFASWTFRKAPKFFDVVTYTGDGVAGRTVAHDLGSVPGMIIIKATSTTGNWVVYHRSVGDNNAAFLNSTNPFSTYNGAQWWNNTIPTSTQFTVGTNSNLNTSGVTYIAYLFAHDAGGFGDDGEQNVISCGSYTGTGATGNAITLGYEPQWLLVKKINDISDWQLVDNMRNFGITRNATLFPNLSNAEDTPLFFSPTATGFTLQTTSTYANGSGSTYIYIAIRRGPMKTPESGTEVFAPDLSPNSNNPRFISGFPVDMAMERSRISTGVDGMDITSRLTTGKYMRTGSTNPEAGSGSLRMDYMNGFDNDGDTSPNWVAHMFRRAPGFMDVVAYTGTGSNAVVKHSLSVIPEVIITKRRDATRNWAYYTNLGASTYTTAIINDTYAPGATPASYDTALTAQPSSTDFYVGTSYDCNAPTGTYVAYLFATLAGVSKVGSYTGTGGNVNVDCGFSSGARFILIKRTDSTGDWYVWDSARGIVAGNDPYLLLNSTAAEVTSTDYIDPLASGFTVTSSAPAALNASGGTYIFLAIA